MLPASLALDGVAADKCPKRHVNALLEQLLKVCPSDLNLPWQVQCHTCPSCHAGGYISLQLVALSADAEARLIQQRDHGLRSVEIRGKAKAITG